MWPAVPRIRFLVEEVALRARIHGQFHTQAALVVVPERTELNDRRCIFAALDELGDGLFAHLSSWMSLPPSKMVSGSSSMSVESSPGGEDAADTGGAGSSAGSSAAVRTQRELRADAG